MDMRSRTKAAPKTTIPPMAWAASATAKGIRLCADNRIRLRSDISKAAIGALEIQKRASVFGKFHALDPAQKNNMVAGFEDVDAQAFQIDQAAGQYRALTVPGLIRPVLEFVFLRSGKPVGQSLLLFI